MTGGIKHDAERFVIHFFSSAGVILLLYFLFSVLNWVWIPERSAAKVGFAAALVFCFSTLREAYDVAHGQTFRKAVVDYASWAGGCVVWSLLLLQVV